MAPFFIRNLVQGDIPALIALPRAEGREMGLVPEIQTWMKVDPGGIFIAVGTMDGEIIGCCSAIILSEHHGYIGMYVVSQKHRGGGIGKQLWNTAVAHLGSRNMCLSAVENMVQCYKDKAGFKVLAGWTVDLYFCESWTFPSEIFINSNRNYHQLTLVNSNGPLVGLVVDYDRTVHSYDRSNIVLSTIEEPGTLCMVAVGTSPDGFPTVEGYACMKKSLQGHWLVAPVYAEDFYVAFALVRGLIGTLNTEQQHEGIVAKLINSNQEASRLFQLLGFKRTKYHLQRLFTKEIVDIPVNRIFALQSSIFCTE